MSGLTYSKYFNELKNDADKRRYQEKVSLLGCPEDPYCRLERTGGQCRSVEWMEWPSVSYADIYNYLINTVSEYTHEMLKAYKSMDGYNFFVNGWVSGILVTLIEGSHKYLFTATVKHSQTLSASPLKVWMCCKSSGEVVTAHCTCMAGCGEACSHIAAVLFAAEANTLVKQQHSSTSLPCTWLPPSFRSVQFLPLAEIDFTTPRTKRKKFLETVSPAPKKSLSIPKPTDAMLSEHYTKLCKTKHKPVLLSLVSGYNDDFVPLYVQKMLPEPMTSLFNSDHQALLFPDLLKACDSFYDMVSITPEQVDMVELKTRDQSKCKLWYEQRAGRVTASNLRKVLHTNLSKPSVSLMKSICYPESAKFYSKACEFGRRHEADALRMYNDSMKSTHTLFELKSCGLFLDVDNPYIGASPDGIISCSCCGKGVVEVKCPFSCRDISFDLAVKNKTFCLQEETFLLKQDHAYYFQVQLQMNLCKVKFCDFVVWGKNGNLTQRIDYDEQCINNALTQVKSFVKLCLLPELFSRCFTSGKKTPASDSDEECEDDDHDLLLTNDDTEDQPTGSTGTADEDNALWCYCRQGEDFDQMIACDGEDCAIEWFHWSCVNLNEETVPSGEWYCPDCADQ